MYLSAVGLKNLTRKVVTRCDDGGQKKYVKTLKRLLFFNF